MDKSSNVAVAYIITAKIEEIVPRLMSLSLGQFDLVICLIPSDPVVFKTKWKLSYIDPVLASWGSKI